MQVCELHAKIQESLDQHNIFVGRTELKLDNMCISMTKVTNRVDQLVEIAEQNRYAICDLKAAIQNGTQASKDRYLEKVAKEELAKEESVPGFAGSLNRAFIKIRENFALYILLGGVGLSAWYLLQVILKHTGLRDMF